MTNDLLPQDEADTGAALVLPADVRVNLVSAVVQHVLDVQDPSAFIEGVVRGGYHGWDRASDRDLLNKVADSYASVEELWPAFDTASRASRLEAMADAIREQPLRQVVLDIATREFLCEPDFWDSLNRWCAEHGKPVVFTEDEFEASYWQRHGRGVDPADAPAAPRG